LALIFDILKATERVNRQRVNVFLEKVCKALWVIKGKQEAVLGLAFKAKTDDIRSAPALEVVKYLLDEGAIVRVSDPEAISGTKALFPKVTYHDDPYEALEGADAALVFTELDIFRTLNRARAKSLMPRGLITDGRNLYSPQKMRELGLEYYSFGRQ
jgi:UDPglucose 6-dehydrogenase